MAPDVAARAVQTDLGEARALVPVCIAGMHRAGTSLVASLLHPCGLDLGSPDELLPPAPDNRDGFFERARFVEVNDRLLAAFGGSWSRPPQLTASWTSDPAVAALRTLASELVEGNSEPWGWKDPRTSLTLPFWRQLVPGLRTVVVARSPSAVARSLAARSESESVLGNTWITYRPRLLGWSGLRLAARAAKRIARRSPLTAERGIALWIHYYRSVLAAVPESERLVVRYENLAAQPAYELERLVEFAGLSPEPTAIKRAAARVRPLPPAADMRSMPAEAAALDRQLAEEARA